jgi:hypothetical protein
MTEKEIIQTAERLAGDKWRLLYPRIYTSPPHGYCSPKLPAAMLIESLRKPVKDRPFDKPVVTKLIQYSMPTLWLSSSLRDAIRNTVPPNTYDMLDIQLPLPAMTILLPDDTIRGRSGEVRFISYARYEPWEIASDGATSPDPHLFFVSGATDLTIQSLSVGRASSKLNLGDLDTFLRVLYQPGHTHSDDTGQGSDDERNKQCMFYFLSTMLIMLSRPDLITEPKLLNRIPARKGEAPREFWSPHILGKTYAAKREAPVVGSHNSPRLHWVRGFYRNQPIGPRTATEKQHRLTWIEPFLRGV